jgi:DNA-binding transcriptional LysR family regulator
MFVIVDMQRIESDDQAPMLLDGRIDVGYVRLPIEEAGLRVTPLYTEPQVAVLPAGHRQDGRFDRVKPVGHAVPGVEDRDAGGARPAARGGA